MEYKTIDFTISGKIYNALQVVKAKKDVRYYFRYICINLKTNSIETTDGHRALRINNIFDNSLHKDIEIDKILFSTVIKAPAKCLRVNIEFSAQFDDVTITFYDKSDGEILAFKPEMRANDNYPELSRVITAKNIETTKIDKLGFNPNLLCDVSKALKATMTKFTFYDSSISVDFYKDKEIYKDIDFVLMPMRT